MPLSIEPDPNNSGGGIDITHIADSYWLSPSDNTSYIITATASISNLVIDGSNSWDQGLGGFYADNVRLSNMHISNVRYEQALVTTGYMLYLNNLSGVAAQYQNLYLHNLTAGLTNGYYLRNFTNVKMDGISHVSADMYIDVDNTVQTMSITNSFIGSDTKLDYAGMGMREIYSYYGNVTYPNVLYSGLFVSDQTYKDRWQEQGIKTYKTAGVIDNTVAGRIYLTGYPGTALSIMDSAAVPKVGRVGIFGASNDQSIKVGGTVLVTADNVVLVDNTSQFAAVDSTQDNTVCGLCVYREVAGDAIYIWNNLGAALNYILTIEWY